jgi:hypothetical protein
MDGFDVSELVPRGFVVESSTKDDGYVIAIRGIGLGGLAGRAPFASAGEEAVDH